MSDELPADLAGLPHPNVFVKPVPPGWDEDRLRALFAAYGEVDSVRISPEGLRPGSSHAFIRFRDVDAAAAAIAGLRGAALDGAPVAVKLADADVAPRLESGLVASEWCYCRGLPPLAAREDVLALFAAHGAVLDVKHFPSTEHYKASGALVQMAAHDDAAAAIAALHGRVLPGAAQPLMVRYADSPAEKAAKAARKERAPRGGAGAPGAAGVLALQEALQRQLLELALAQGSGGLASAFGAPAAQALDVLSGAFGAYAAAPAPPPGLGGAGAPRGGAAAGCSVYVKGLPEGADKLWMYEKFARFGAVLSVRVLVDDATGRCNGVGFVNFSAPDAARAAHEAMNGVGMGDRLLHVMVQNGAPAGPGGGGYGSGSSGGGAGVGGWSNPASRTASRAPSGALVGGFAAGAPLAAVFAPGPPGVPANGHFGHGAVAW
jgi:hypothetical protein